LEFQMSSAVIGRLVVTLVGIVLLLDGILQAMSPPAMTEALAHVGFGADAGPRLAVITITCAALLVIPRAAPVGALLTTAFLGGAVCSHYRIGEVGSPPQLICLALGLAMWIGICLAEPLARSLLLPRR
jgi:hypothetical protein